MKRILTISGWCLLTVAPVHATTWYFQTTGSDSNPCSYSRPCRSFGASAVVNGVAAGDTYLALDSVDFSAGTYAFGFTAITIDGGEHGAYLTGNPTIAVGAVVLGGSASQPSVLRNLTISAAADSPAIFVNLTAGSIILDHVTILTAGGAAAAIAGTIQSGSYLHLKDVTIIGAGNGIALANMSGAPFSFDAERLTIDVTGSGVALTDGYGVIRDSVFRGSSTSTGLALLSSSTTPTWLLDTCSFRNLAYGLVAGSPGTVRISNSEFTGNGFGVFGGGTVISYRNNVFAGNVTDGGPLLSTSLK